jgi:electron transport complex protein RnfB
MEILYSALLLLGLAALFSGLLAYFGKKLQVEKDPRIDAVRGLLSGANCGACGYAGCDDFAKNLVEGKASLSNCPSTSKENKDKIGDLLGVSNTGEETIVKVFCCGGNTCKDKYDYQGYGDCKSMELLSGGRKACPVGCMGMGSCTDACHYHAVDVNTQGFSEVNNEKCVNCGACIAACPKGLIKRIPKSAKIMVACSNHGRGKEVSSVCKSGCIGCGLCVKTCKYGAITLDNNLAVVDYSKCTGCLECVQKCPTKVIKVL